MTVVLTWLFAGMTVILAGMLLLALRGRGRLKESERRSRLGAEHARLHLSVLARAGDEMSGALESYEEALSRLVQVVVPVFSDWFAIDLVDESGEVHRVAVGDTGGSVSPDSAHRHPEGDVLVRRVVESGQHEVLANARGGPHEGGLVVLDDTSQAPQAPGVESMVIVPVHVRGLALGALSFVTGPGRRGYRLSDLETAYGLAERVAVAIERVLLWRESRQAEVAATVRAEQLRRLMEAALAVNAPLAEAEILGVVAEHARRVLGAERAWVCTVPPRGAIQAIEAVSTAGVAGGGLGEVAPVVSDLVVEFDRPLRSGDDRQVEGLPEGLRLDPSQLPATSHPWLACPVPGPVTGSAVESHRVVVVEGVSSADQAAGGAFRSGFSSEDEWMLVLLAQIVSVALMNANLYQDVRGSERRLRAVVDSSPLAIAELALNGDARWWNHAAEALLGDPGAAAGPTGLKRMPVHSDSQDAWRGILDRSSHAAASMGTEIRATTPDGEITELSVSSAPLLDQDGQVGGILVVAEDVTDRKRVLEQMHQSERLAAMARLAGGVAHDFNNLLTVILGSSDLLSRRDDADESWQEEIEAIQRAGQRAAALTAQLLAIGRHRDAEAVVLDLDAELSSMIPMLGRALGDDVRIDLSPDGNGARILADPGDLERAVLNLAINARDAMPEGGTFELSTRLVSSEHPSGELGSGSADLVVLAVTDTGEGMDEHTAERCLEPFFSTKPEGSGTGLGLFAVQAIVTQAGGGMRVDSSPGHGTTFTMWFPSLGEVTEAVRGS